MRREKVPFEETTESVASVNGWKRPMFGTLDTPVIAEMERLHASGDPLDAAIFELWRGRSVVSSVRAARLSREQADALLRALGEMPDTGDPVASGSDAA